MTFRIGFIDRNYSTFTTNKFRLVPVRYSTNAIGGPKAATIIAYGDIMALNDLNSRLRYGVTIYNPFGRAVWWGYLDSVDIYALNHHSSVGLGNMWNDITVEYTGKNNVTRSTSNTLASSVTEYGTKEIIVSSSDSDTSTAAQTLRDRLVEFYGLPRVERTINYGNTDTYAQLNCIGWWETLDWKYYTNTGESNVATTAQISTIISNAGQFLVNPHIEDASGIDTLETRDGKQRARREVEKLLEIGTTNNRRLLSYVNQSRTVIIKEEKAPNTNDYKLKNGKLYTGLGSPVHNSECPSGVWVVITTGVIGRTASRIISDPGRFFVEEAEYEVATNRWTPTPRGSYIPGGGL